MAAAWFAAAESASKAAEALNGAVREHGPRSGWGMAQGDWVDEHARCERQASALELLVVEAD